MLFVALASIDGLFKRCARHLNLSKVIPINSPKLETLAGDDRIRRFLLPGFPYLIVYESFDTEVFVYAVAHASRRPNYWRRRKQS